MKNRIACTWYKWQPTIWWPFFSLEFKFKALSAQEAQPPAYAGDLANVAASEDCSSTSELYRCVNAAEGVLDAERTKCVDAVRAYSRDEATFDPSSGDDSLVPPQISSYLLGQENTAGQAMFSDTKNKTEAGEEAANSFQAACQKKTGRIKGKIPAKAIATDSN